MRSKVLSYLLSFSLIFYVGFGSSITASAAEVSPDAENEWFLLPFNYSDDFNQKGSFDSVTGTFNSSGGSYSGQYRHFSVSQDSTAVMPVFEQGHSYLVYMTFTSVGSQSGSVFRSSIRYNWGDWSSSLPLDSAKIIHNSSNYAAGTNTYTTIWQLNNINSSHIISTSSQFQIDFGSSVTTSGRIGWAMYALDITDSSESDVNQIIAAIQDQTSDIQQSIEDQYSGDPGSSFPVDDIITQHNEKMGVLSFGSDTLMQVLGLLSPDQSLSSELVFPSMSLTIAGQRNKVQLWPEYRFDLNELKQHWPDFIGLMQSLTTALVWIFVLRYCYRVFEKYFLAGGGN